MCDRPCPCYLTGGDTHILCIACWGEKHTQSAFENTGCEHCDMLTDAPIPPGVFSRTLRLAFPRALVPLLPRHSEGCGPGVRKMDLSAKVETGTALSLPSPDGFSASYQG